MTDTHRLATVVYSLPPERVDGAASWLADVVGLPLRFRAGTDWVAFDAGGVTLAIEGVEGASEQATPRLCFRAADLDDTVEQLAARGGVPGAVQRGGHERRARLPTPFGDALLFYEPLPTTTEA